MEQEKINRINALAKKSKTTGLTEEEKEEQKILRAEYVAAFRASLEGQLGSMTIVRPDGTKHKVTKKSKK